MSEQKNPEQKLVEVTLAKPHTHAGNSYAAGAVIKVTESDRAWLIQNNVVNGSKEGAK